MIAPADEATGIDPADVTFSFTSKYTPSGKYKVELYLLNLHKAVIDGNPGAETSFGLAAFASTESMDFERSYQWRARAIADEPAVDATYAWGPMWSFTTALGTPDGLGFNEEHCAALPEIFDREVLVPGATQYDFEYQQIPVGTSVQDVDGVAPLGELMKKTWLQADFAEQTATYESLTGITLPAGQIALPLPGTVCDQAHYAYRAHYRVYKGTNCSKFSGWMLFWDVSGSG